MADDRDHLHQFNPGSGAQCEGGKQGVVIEVGALSMGRSIGIMSDSSHPTE